MDRAPRWMSTLNLCLLFLQLFIATGNSIPGVHVGSKMTNDNNPGFISIDCGADMDYFNNETGIWYQADKDFVGTGTNHRVSPNVDLNYAYFGKQISTLRRFPDGKKNCYTLQPKQGKNNTYLIRATFAYGNYDGKNDKAVFDLYLGVTYWSTISPKPGIAFRPEPGTAFSPEPGTAFSSKLRTTFSPAFSPDSETAFSSELGTTFSPTFSPESETAFSLEPGIVFSPAFSPEPEIAFSPEPGTAFSPEPKTAFSPEPRTTFSPEPGIDFIFREIIHTPSTDTIHVCLVNIDQGTPFISSLELRLLDRSIYQTMPTSQSLLPLDIRIDIGASDSQDFSRYKDDIYDRFWGSYNPKEWTSFNGLVDIDPDSTNDAYKLPAQVLRSAAKSSNVVDALKYDFNKDNKSSKYYVYFHFAEIEKLPPGEKRIINVFLNDENISEPLTLEYLKPVTISNKNAIQDLVRFIVNATSESDAPPILNAFEVYRLIDQPSSPTDTRDVDAILDIKSTYKISRLNWQGDPCVPNQFAWEGLVCSTDDIDPRITSLNLSSSTLMGEISTSFSYLTELESLDLSNNQLTGPLPEFLAELPKLKILNLTGNKLSGPIPKALKEKADTTLQLSLADNPGLCMTDSCEKHKFVVPLVASISAFVLIILLSLGIWIFKRRRQVVHSESKKEGSWKSKNRAFSYSEILNITDNFRTIIGEGGFGKVYLGILQDHTQVAVKVLSPSSVQGYKEFRSEAQLLMIVHHRNLVNLIGYCDERETKALIYEYMANGNLHQHLSDKNPNILKWSERLQIAVDAANGLDYLHNGCKPPLVHRDLKTSNILLNENMQAKIADFGLCRAYTSDIDSHISTRPAGTPGYVDPEFHRTGNSNRKSDVYSLGIILFELITGQPAVARAPGKIIHILQWVIPTVEKGDIQSIVDPRLQGEFNINSVWKAVEIALSCISPAAAERPDVSQILMELKECLSLEMVQRYIKRSSNMLELTSLQFESEMVPSAR